MAEQKQTKSAGKGKEEVESPAIQARVPGWKASYKVLQYNIDRAVPHEKTNPFNERSARIQALICSVKADIVNLQELRELEKTAPVELWLSTFASMYRFVVGYRNPGALSFGQATLYDWRKLFPLERSVKWLSATPDEVSDGTDPKGFGCIVLSTRFAPVHEGKIVVNAPTFWVDNLHFPLDEKAKTKCCEFYIELIKGRKEPTVTTGDLNFFPDGDADKQRAILTKGGFEDLGAPGHITSQDKQRWHSTFVGFACDPFKAPLDVDRKSRLDHILIRGGFAADGPVTLHTETMLREEPKELSSRDLPSDHLALSAALRLSAK